MTETFYPTSTLPAPYDIVWCRFPTHEDLGNPGPKPRPAIVLNAALIEDTIESEVHVIYGTTNLKMMQRRDDFFVTNLAEMDICGLDKATRFDLDRMAWLPWAKEWFTTLPGYSSPVVGHLSGHGIRLLQYELAWRRQRLQIVDDNDDNGEGDRKA